MIAQIRLVVLTTLACAATVTACAEQPELLSGGRIEQDGAGAPPLKAQENRDLAALRAATARLHRFDQREAAGYIEQFPAGCFEDLENGEGAMGLHYINWDNVGTLDPARPQLVMYEPQKNGSMRLVGVEFIAPGLPTDDPPVLFNQRFAWNPVFEVWVLHVWAWQHNPAGMYKNWNSRVSCQYAPLASASHH